MGNFCGVNYPNSVGLHIHLLIQGIVPDVADPFEVPQDLQYDFANLFLLFPPAGVPEQTLQPGDTPELGMEVFLL